MTVSTPAQEVIERRHASYEVLPYCVIVEERPQGATPTVRRIQAGFDIDVYGMKNGDGPGISPDYEVGHAALQSIAATILSHATDGLSVEVIPFTSTVFIDTRQQFEQKVMLRIRITHCRGLDQPAGSAEERALEEAVRELQQLGVRPRGRT